MAGSGLHISISAEKVVSVGPLDISNSILTSLIVSVLILSFAVIVKVKLKKTGKISGIQNFAELMIEAIYSLIDGITEDKKKTRNFFPIIFTFFIFILANNWLGLFPGVGTIGFIEKEDKQEVVLQQPELEIPVTEVYASSVEAESDEVAKYEVTAQEVHQEEVKQKEGGKFIPFFRAGTADLNTTLALGLISVVVTQWVGIKYLKLSYFKKYIDLSNPIMFFVGLLEIISEFAKIISFAFRLFGNIFAGEVLLAVIGFLIPVIAPMPFYGLEVFVGFIQALVFSLLSIVFFNMATIGHDDH